MFVTDEVEAAGQVKVCLVLSFLYGELCMRKVYERKDHDCCLRGEGEIFENFYDSVKTEIDLNMFHGLCEQFTKLAGIPMTTEWDAFICSLPRMSARSVFFFWKDLRHTCSHKEEIIVDFVDMMCDTMNGKAWDEKAYVIFKSIMKDE